MNVYKVCDFYKSELKKYCSRTIQQISPHVNVNVLGRHYEFAVAIHTVRKLDKYVQMQVLSLSEVSRIFEDKIQRFKGFSHVINKIPHAYTSNFHGLCSELSD